MDRARAQHPLCPNCGEPMKLLRVVPGGSGLAPLNVFSCGRCGVYYSEAEGEPSAAAGNGAHC